MKETSVFLLRRKNFFYSSAFDNILVMLMIKCNRKNERTKKMQEDIVFLESEKALTARLMCEIDHHTARLLRERIDSLLFEKKPEQLVLDFSGVRFMDSSGLGLILGRVETARALGGSVRIVGLSEPLLRLLRLSGVDRVKNLSIGT